MFHSNRIPEPTQLLALKTVRNICIKSESNRERLTWEMNMIAPLLQVIRKDKPSAELVREVRFRFPDYNDIFVISLRLSCGLHYYYHYLAHTPNFVNFKSQLGKESKPKVLSVQHMFSICVVDGKCT